MNDYIDAIRAMALIVSRDQNCVLEVIIGEGGMLAHLIPQDLWDEEMEEIDD